MVPKERLDLKERFFCEETIQSENKHHITCSHNALGVSVLISSWDQFPLLHRQWQQHSIWAEQKASWCNVCHCRKKEVTHACAAPENSIYRNAQGCNSGTTIFISLYCSSYICPQPVFFKWLYISGGCLRSIWLFVCCLSLREGYAQHLCIFSAK